MAGRLRLVVVEEEQEEEGEEEESSTRSSSQSPSLQTLSSQIAFGRYLPCNAHSSIPSLSPQFLLFLLGTFPAAPTPLILLNFSSFSIPSTLQNQG